MVDSSGRESSPGWPTAQEGNGARGRCTGSRLRPLQPAGGSRPRRPAVRTRARPLCRTPARRRPRGAGKEEGERAGEGGAALPSCGLRFHAQAARAAAPSGLLATGLSDPAARARRQDDTGDFSTMAGVRDPLASAPPAPPRQPLPPDPLLPGTSAPRAWPSRDAPRPIAFLPLGRAACRKGRDSRAPQFMARTPSACRASGRREDVVLFRSFQPQF